MKDGAIVFTGGKINIQDDFYQGINDNEYDIFCADSGANYTYQLKLIPKAILGDFDSVDMDIIEYYKKFDTEIRNFSVEKDKTDTELILDYIVKFNYKKIYLFGALGERSDHMLANIFIMENYNNIIISNENEEIMICNNYLELNNFKGKTVSILAITDRCKIKDINGFKYELKNEIIKRNSSRGISNVILNNNAFIEVQEGKLLLFINKKINGGENNEKDFSNDGNCRKCNFWW